MNRADGGCRAVRLLALMALLKERPRRVAELAEHFGVSVQAIYRDLRTLQDAPFRLPLVGDDGIWRMSTLQPDKT